MSGPKFGRGSDVSPINPGLRATLTSPSSPESRPGSFDETGTSPQPRKRGRRRGRRDGRVDTRTFAGLAGPEAQLYDPPTCGVASTSSSPALSVSLGSQGTFQTTSNFTVEVGVGTEGARTLSPQVSKPTPQTTTCTPTPWARGPETPYTTDSGAEQKRESRRTSSRSLRSSSNLSRPSYSLTCDTPSVTPARRGAPSRPTSRRRGRSGGTAPDPGPCRGPSRGPRTQTGDGRVHRRRG